MYGIIYKATNLINGKIYIGQTTLELKERKRGHIYDASIRKYISVFHRAIRKYGEDNFKWEVIDKASNSDELNQKETHWIDFFNTYLDNDNSNGYNMTTGGGNYQRSEETKEKMRNNHADMKGENHPFYGKNHSDKTKQKMSELRKDENNPKARSVVQLSIDGEFINEFKTIKEGALATDSDRANISKVCNGKYKQHNGFKWMYVEDYYKN
ncbi:NUMOD3 domain-containing DNA-binding protein [Klebsiella pneumoniae]|nr:NUMOD3 domain-containing DNA-binding protein [Klebsiella pneumoniae]MDS7714349.1 NUMOD3 domain-containing DNA-binding protein [Klebsiella pneumoniae]